MNQTKNRRISALFCFLVICSLVMQGSYAANEEISDAVVTNEEVSDVIAVDRTSDTSSGEEGIAVEPIALPVIIASPNIEETRTESKIESEGINIKLETLPKETEENILVKHELPKEEVKEEVKEEFKETEVVKPKESTCVSAATDYLQSTTFDCQQVFTKEDSKAVPLYTGTGKKYAYIETTLPVEQDKTLLQIKHSVEFPTQQDISVFYLEDNVWKGACHNLKSTSQGSTSACDLSGVAKDKEQLNVRVEAYAREGKAIWLVDDLQMVPQRKPDDGVRYKQIPPAIPIQPTDPTQPIINNPGGPTSPPFIPNGGFKGVYPSFQTQANSGFQSENQRQQESITPQQNNLETVVPENTGFLRLTGRAIADLATKNPFGALLTLLLLGLVIYGVYRSSKKYR